MSDIVERAQAKRVQRKRTRGWRKPAGAVIVSRPSRWGNPFVVGGRTHVLRLGVWHPVSIPDAETAVDLYRQWITGDLRTDVAPPRAREIAQLRGRALICYCPPGQPCHADVLIELANRGGS